MWTGLVSGVVLLAMVGIVQIGQRNERITNARVIDEQCSGAGSKQQCYVHIAFGRFETEIADVPISKIRHQHGVSVVRVEYRVGNPNSADTPDGGYMTLGVAVMLPGIGVAALGSAAILRRRLKRLPQASKRGEPD
jgi:hypothetical protein